MTASLEEEERRILWGGAIGRARAFLLSELEGGPRLANDMKREADKRGIWGRTLDRAKADLHVVSMKEPGQGGRWMWSLTSRSGLLARRLDGVGCE